MKKTFCILALSLSILFIGCQEKNAPIDNSELVKVIENETKTFYEKDFENWSSNFVQDNRVSWICVEPEILLRANGWEDLSKFVGSWMKENPKPIDYKKANFKITDLKVTTQPNMAFVSFKYSNENSDVAVNKSIESRVFLLENKNWKILSMVSYPDDNSRNSTQNIYNYDCK